MTTGMLAIPIPPSVNNIWRSIHKPGTPIRVIKSRAYRDWLTNTVPLIRHGMPRPVPPVRVLILIHSGKGWQQRRDLDNVVKAIMDAIKIAGNIEDDSTRYVHEIRVRFVSGGAMAQCEVGFFSEEEIQ